jgi:hypothetical protein
MAAVLLGLLLVAATVSAAGIFNGIFQFPAMSADWEEPPAADPVSLGVEDDGRTVYVNKGDTVQFTFIEYGGDDTWVMRPNPDVRVTSDLVRESYPMQHVVTVKVLAPTTIAFDRKAAPDGGKRSVTYHIGMHGSPAAPPDQGYPGPVPDPTFDNPIDIIDGDTFKAPWSTGRYLGLDTPAAWSGGVRQPGFLQVVPFAGWDTMAAPNLRASGARSDQPELRISADRQSYSPIMSSTVGIGLTPEYTSGMDGRTVRFRWQTDFGHFLSWGPPGYKVEDLGRDVTTGGGKIYWSYSPDDMGREKLPVHVTLSMIDEASGQVLGTAGLEIGWESGHVARVKK